MGEIKFRLIYKITFAKFPEAFIFIALFFFTIY